VAGWVLYDLANTIFSLNIISLYFSLWVVSDMGGRDGDYLLANSFSMGLMFIAAPFLGALSDQRPRRMPFLVVSTIVCCFFTFFLGTWGLGTSLVLFIIANFAYQGGLIFYDALLPAVSTEDNRGRIGGLGVGIGYLGSLLGLAIGSVTIDVFGGSKTTVFRLTAIAFFLLALPCFLFVVEIPKRMKPRPAWALARDAMRELRQTSKRIGEYRGLGRFLIGRIFYADAANTMIATMGIYATKEIGYSDSEVQLVLLAGIAGAIPGGIVWGRIVDRIAPKRTLQLVLLLWAVVMASTAAIALLDLPRAVFWAVAPIAGIALGGTWAADRPFMLRLSPPLYLGQFYGFYAMVGRFAAILGPLLWTVIVDGFGWGRPAAVLSLLVMVVIAHVIISPVDDGPRAWPASDLAVEP
jgi:UMF1 family MFS transporter